MNDIQKLKDRREQLTSEVERLRAELLHYETAQAAPESIQRGQERDVQDQYADRKRKCDSLDFEIDRLSQKIVRRENIANHETLMAGYRDAMATWKADEHELNEKRQSVSTRLNEIRQQATDEMAKARQAETEAATAYAQAVAWGDTEGEKTANADAQKAAKNLATVAEHNRRQQLMISALEQELSTIDQHIAEAQQEHQKIENKALHLANAVLEEKWNEAAQALLDVGGQLCAARRMIDRDPVALLKLNVPEQGENFSSWDWSDLSERSVRYKVQDVLAL
ncbi:chromosome segregation protein SMC [Pseudomonas sp. S3_F07]